MLKCSIANKECSKIMIFPVFIQLDMFYSFPLVWLINMIGLLWFLFSSPLVWVFLFFFVLVFFSWMIDMFDDDCYDLNWMRCGTYRWIWRFSIIEFDVFIRFICIFLTLFFSNMFHFLLILFVKPLFNISYNFDSYLFLHFFFF